MDAEPSLDYSNLLEIYDQKRRISARLGGEIIDCLEQDEIDEGGRRLGILRRGVFVLGSETEMDVVMDFSIHYVYRQGKNAIDRYLEKETRRISPEARDTLQRMAAARYCIFDIDRVEPGVGVLVTDRLLRDSQLLVDRGMSRCLSAGDVFAAAIIEFDKFWMTTGAGLPMPRPVWDRLERPIVKRFGKPGPKYRKLDRWQQSDLANWCVRGCLEAGMGERVKYLNVTP